MPAQSIKVIPPALLEAASSVAATAAKAAKPPTVVPHGVPGSPADSAWAAIALDMVKESGAMSVQVGVKGPQMEEQTATGTAQLQAQDGENAVRIQAVGASVAGQIA